YATITLYGSSFQMILIRFDSNVVVLQPQNCRNNSGLAFSASARHYLRTHFCFLLLRLLTSFSSTALLAYRSAMPSTCRVAPFSFLRLPCCVPIPAAFGSLSRLSPPLRA